MNIKEQINFSPDKYVTRILHDSERMRSILFCLLPGQKVEPHTTTSEVLFYLIQGKATFILGEERIDLEAGAYTLSKSNQPHGFEAKEDLVVLAIIAPRP